MDIQRSLDFHLYPVASIFETYLHALAMEGSVNDGNPAVPPSEGGPSIWELVMCALKREDEPNARRLGTTSILMRSQKLTGYPEARAAWFRAWRVYAEKNDHTGAWPTKAKLTWEEQKTVTITIVRNARQNRGFLLHNFASVIWLAAKKGDLSFFRELGSAIEASEAAAIGEVVSLHLLTYWFSGALWLMSASEKAKALKRYCGCSCGGSACSHAAKRLGLVDYKTFLSAPPIIHFDERRKHYVFRKGWTWEGAPCPNAAS